MLNFGKVGDLSMFPLLSTTTFGWGRQPGSPTNCWEIPLVQKSLQHPGCIKTHFENLWNDWTNLPNLHYRKLIWQWKIHHLKMYLLLIMGIFQCHVSSQGCTFFGADFEQPNIIKTSSNKIGGSILRVVRVTFKAGIYLGGQGISWIVPISHPKCWPFLVGKPNGSWVPPIVGIPQICSSLFIFAKVWYTLAIQAPTGPFIVEKKHHVFRPHGGEGTNESATSSDGNFQFILSYESNMYALNIGRMCRMNQSYDFHGFSMA